MKANPLTQAIVAGICAAATTLPVAAMNLNPLGTGQVLIYPYYTVSAGNQTLISVVNRTDTGKAVKVRFREGRNARIALEFNLYLSPFDVWVASAFAYSDTPPNNPANLITLDNSCTVPRIKGNTALPALSNGARYASFSNYSYSGSNDDAGANTLDRNREGYFEMIEMGEVGNRDRNSLAAITHGATGVPANCLQVERAWLPAGFASETTAYWTTNALVDLTPPKGGLFGTASIIDALAGTMMSYNAEAIDAFSDIVQHLLPGSGQPTLASARSNADSAIAYVFDDGALVTSSYPLSRAIDAVSALFVQDDLLNEFVTNPSVGGATEWVVTLPTKYAYTDQAMVGSTAIAPFTRIFPATASSQNSGTSAADIREVIFNREEGPNASFCNDPLFCFPFPGQPIPPPPQWFWASNVISFNQANAAVSGSNILGSRQVVDLPVADLGVFDGWLKVALYSATNAAEDSLIDRQRLRPDQSGGIWNGLPVIGFQASSYTNGQLVPGVLSNYASIQKHRGGNRYVARP